jgi:hypothetical protein
MPIFDRRFRDMMLMDYDLKNQGGLLGGQQGATGGLLGGLSNINPNLLIGAQIAGAGFKGVDPFSAITPAVLQTAQIQKLLAPQEVKPKARLLSAEEISQKFPDLPEGSIVQEKPDGTYTFEKPTAGEVEKKATRGAVLDTINSLEKRIDKQGTGLFEGFLKSVGSKIGLNKDYAEFSADTKGLELNVIKALRGANVSAAEETNVRKILPSIYDTEDVYKAKLSSLKKYLKNVDDRIKGGVITGDAKILNNLLSELENVQIKDTTFDLLPDENGVYDLTK